MQDAYIHSIKRQIGHLCADDPPPSQPQPQHPAPSSIRNIITNHPPTFPIDINNHPLVHTQRTNVTFPITNRIDIDPSIATAPPSAHPLRNSLGSFHTPSPINAPIATHQNSITHTTSGKCEQKTLSCVSCVKCSQFRIFSNLDFFFYFNSARIYSDPNSTT